jgi:hypothetical protein
LVIEEWAPGGGNLDTSGGNLRARFTIPTLVTIGLVLAAGPAGAVDHGLFGRRVVLRATPAAAWLNALLHDAVVAPTPGGPDDPSLVGATSADMKGGGCATE